ncbi:MAG: hypothetical protein IKV24_01440 [Bacteroidaceae bacterium]|nr:hypothetical protein [Bacteroidaceae bacterium]
MKKQKFFLAVLAIAIAAGLTSCDNDVIWDIVPIRIHITVSNADGQNLLDPTTPNCIDFREVTAEWMGESYAADTISLFEKQQTTRLLMAHMHGLVYTIEHGKAQLYFGDLTGHNTFNDEPLTLHWPDGTTDVITIKASAVEGYKSVKLNRKFKLNGKVVAKDTSSPTIEVVK